MKLATTHPMALQSGIAFTYLVKYLVATKIQMFPFEGGLIAPTKSNPQVWNGHDITILYRL